MSVADTEHATNTDAEIAYPKNFKVILHNDNYTSFDFVIELLITVFNKSELEAIRITQAVHEQNYGVAGLYSKEVAEQKAHEGMFHASRAGFPLLLTVESE